MARNSYANAEEVLPGDVVARIQQYFAGGMLWVPTIKTKAEERREAVLRLFSEGASNRRIARELDITRRRVRQILGEERQRIVDADAPPPSPAAASSTTPNSLGE